MFAKTISQKISSTYHGADKSSDLIRNLGKCYRSAIEHIFAKEEEKKQLEALWDAWWEENRAEFD